MRMPRRDEGRRISPMVYAGAGAFLLLAALLVGPGISRWLAGRNEQPSPAQLAQSWVAKSPFPAAAWHREQHQRVSFDSPVSLKPDPAMSGEMREVLVSKIDSVEVLTSQDEARDFEAMLMQTVYKSSINPNLDGAVNGAMKEAAAELREPSPKFSSMVTTVDGFSARRLSYPIGTATSKYIEAIYISDGSIVWNLVVTGSGETFRRDAKRLIDSVKLSGGSPTTTP